ncbi:DUF805 domain-containing protein [Pseudomonas fuscovaginae UPB0736]|uniref:Uncharacterized membrane protein YhaH, DUF805 family n=1 Tax=Pseudomonas asplenii TaxID=53407 RepID=A0A1H6MS28_9PSED|nr:DUF805 domain-containing protein [Pseudomonas fuscovaginae]UUQ62914.1 DUF805 domain-containing protein [Pseudomonas fuscovaginae UPB0736]SEI00519.1 Uncharacterized membrane protein YhaH, DUF805 family [Pseudomonas fuscovaginae]
MSNTRFKIVFDGTLLPGVEQTTAQFNLAELFKSDIASVEKLFNGRPIALKRDLSATEAQSYLEALRNTGIDARIVEETPTGELSLADVNELPASVPPQAIGESHSPYTTPPASREAYSPYAPPAAKVTDTLPTFGPLKVFTLNGRIGRLRYLAWSMTAALATLVLIMLLVSILKGFAVVSGLAIIVAVAFYILLTIQIAVQRLHDIGWSGWLWLLTLVPIAGYVLPFVLMFYPGNVSANRYGAPPPPNSKAVKVLSIVATFFVFLIGVLFALAAASIKHT